MYNTALTLCAHLCNIIKIAREHLTRNIIPASSRVGTQLLQYSMRAYNFISMLYFWRLTSMKDILIAYVQSKKSYLGILYAKQRYIDKICDQSFQHLSRNVYNTLQQQKEHIFSIYKFLYG